MSWRNEFQASSTRPVFIFCQIFGISWHMIYQSRAPKALRNFEKSTNMPKKIGKKWRKDLFNLPYTHFSADFAYPKIQFRVKTRKQQVMIYDNSHNLKKNCSGNFEISSKYTPAMKFFLAIILMIFGKLKRQLGRFTNELFEMSTVSSWVHLEISSGSVDIRLWDKFNSVKKK